ncbi:cytochrome P450 [Nocardia sp. NPDC051756]|uniref:cytochrome P450 n=1 Tax=Nocardia sp. NPDC051756 TaxID=3154751 RepID=UPI00341C8E8E
METRTAFDSTVLDELDLADPVVHATQDLSEVWRYLRDEQPLYRHRETERGEGFWVITRRDDMATLYTDNVSFTSARGNMLDTLLAKNDSAVGRMLTVTDGPEHSALRAAIGKPFSPRALTAIVDSVRSGTRKLVQEATQRAECDFAVDVAAHVPLAAICDLFVVPDEDRRHLIGLTSGTLAAADGPPTAEGMWAARNDLLLYISQQVARRRGRSGDDVLSVLIDQEVAGRRLTHEEIIFNCYSIIIGGLETTRFAMVGGVHALAQNTDQWQLLRDGTVRTGSAVEEILRWTTPTLHSGRTATTDLLLFDQLIEEGDIVTMWNASANRDERAFAEPDRFVLARDPNKHLTFAHGPHYCMGAYLARAELSAMLEALRDSVSEIRMTGPARRVYSNFLSGYSTMPVQLVPAG